MIFGNIKIELNQINAITGNIKDLDAKTAIQRLLIVNEEIVRELERMRINKTK